MDREKLLANLQNKFKIRQIFPEKFAKCKGEKIHFSPAFLAPRFQDI